MTDSFWRAGAFKIHVSYFPQFLAEDYHSMVYMAQNNALVACKYQSRWNQILQKP